MSALKCSTAVLLVFSILVRSSALRKYNSLPVRFRYSAVLDQVPNDKQQAKPIEEDSEEETDTQSSSEHFDKYHESDKHVNHKVSSHDKKDKESGRDDYSHEKDELEHDDVEEVNRKDHHRAELGGKVVKYQLHAKHQKGHSTKGSHSILKKDEFDKKREFYDEFDEDDEHDFEGDHHQEHHDHHDRDDEHTMKKHEKEKNDREQHSFYHKNKVVNHRHSHLLHNDNVNVGNGHTGRAIVWTKTT